MDDQQNYLVDEREIMFDVRQQTSLSHMSHEARFEEQDMTTKKTAPLIFETEPQEPKLHYDEHKTLTLKTKQWRLT